MTINLPQASPFLTAQWRNLTLANYPVSSELLAQYLAPGLELDTFEGSAYVSLVAFDFQNTRVLGVPFPGFINFPEVNLRFYVRDGERRGVQFIREYVPSRLVATIARSLYNEPYYAINMQNTHDKESSIYKIGPYQISTKVFGVTKVPPEHAMEHFFKEHSWGYGVSKSHKLIRYQVDHPIWACRTVNHFSHSVDFGRLYGEPWRILQNKEPRSVIFAEGSAIRVSRKNRGLSSETNSD